jgi:hypothetical protein
MRRPEFAQKVNAMIKPGLISIALSSLWVTAALPTQAQAISQHEPAAAVWSSRDGTVRPGDPPEQDPEVETMDGLSGRSSDAGPSPSHNALVCEPFK